MCRCEKQLISVSIPSNGSSFFQLKCHKSNGSNPLQSLNPLKRVKFISIPDEKFGKELAEWLSLNPLKRVKFISILRFPFTTRVREKSQSPQTGQVYFNGHRDSFRVWKCPFVSIPSNGSSLFQCKEASQIIREAGYSLNPLKRVKFISMIIPTKIADKSLSQPSNPSKGSSLYQ